MKLGEIPRRLCKITGLRILVDKMEYSLHPLRAVINMHGKPITTQGPGHSGVVFVGGVLAIKTVGKLIAKALLFCLPEMASQLMDSFFLLSD